MTPVADHIAFLKNTAAKSDQYKFMDPGFMANLYMPLVSGNTPAQELKVDLLGGGSSEVLQERSA